MANLPRPTKHAKVGSNVRSRKRLAAANEALLERRLKPLRRAERTFRRQRADILTKPKARAAAEIVRPHHDAYTLAFVKAGGDGDKIRKARRRTRAAIDRALRAGIPRYTEYEALRQQHARDLGTLLATHLKSPQVGLDFAAGEILLPGGIAFQQFGPPYALFDVQPPPPESPQDKSFADPKLGVVVTDLSFHNNHNSASGFNIFDFNPAREGDNRSSVGINFRVPQTGFLTLTARMQNLFAKFVMTVEDNFGPSHANLHVDHSIFVTIIRSGVITRSDRVVFANGLISHGSEFSLTFAPILDDTPFTLSFTTQQQFTKGENLQILVGANSFFRIELDDMKSLISALTGWQVKRLSVGIRPVITR
jgi:hypothetical protein